MSVEPNTEALAAPPVRALRLFERLPRLNRLSLRIQVTLLIVATVLLTQAISIGVNFAYLKARMELDTRDRSAGFFRVAVPSVQGAPPELRQAVARSFRNPMRHFTVDEAPALDPALGDVRDPQRAAVVSEFLRGLGLPVAEVVAGSRTTMIPIRPPGLALEDRNIVHLGEGTRMLALANEPDNPPRWAVPGGLDPTPPSRALRAATSHVLALRLEGDPTWYNLATLQPFDPPLGPLFLTSLLTLPIALVLVGASLIVLWRIMRPLRHITVQADRLGRGEPAGDIPEEGGPDMRSTIHAFNTMSHRINQAIDYQVTLMRSLGHDVRGPLAAMSAYVDAVEPPPTRDVLKTCLAQAERITTAIMTYTRATMRDGEIVSVDLISLLEALVEEAAMLEADITLTVVDEPCVPARYNALERALRNLIDNASKYGGSVAVTLRCDQRYAVVEVEDCGPGIPLGDIDDLFEPFARASDTPSGTGLGLAIAKTIVVDHGGTVTLRNRAQGGLRVTVMLPL
ncbi:sensor histidine kinase [Acuticoccus mangrovi]|uniref:histidine kinase n=1 Tax=Acuticoccus mangrovi TaxID=2796142 RepID=A0A934IIL1_9HYPH|nr:ATP-binding protein [Acuticoccus mangrovi]MBJ3775666.1 HAMP domain-containing protein [Acuticoccus mangrovi]